MEPQRTPVDQPTRPRIVRIKHCDQCGAQLNSIEAAYGRCVGCRVPVEPPMGYLPCPKCDGSGRLHFYAGEPEADDCPVCIGRGYVTASVVVRFAQRHHGIEVAS